MMGSRIAVPALVALAVYLLSLAGLAVPGEAFAGEWVQVACEAPSGASAASEGWSSFAQGGPGYGSNTSTACAAGTPMVAILSDAASAPVGSAEVLHYTPPSGSSLAGGSLQVSFYADGSGYNASGTAVAYTPEYAYNGSNVFFQCASGLPPCANNTYDFTGALSIPAGRGGSLYLAAGCGGTSGYSCNSGGSEGAWSLVRLWSARLLLSNSSTPTGSGISGTLLEGGARGVGELSLTAGDPEGPGVYRVLVQAEGRTLYEGTPDANGGRCAPLGESEGTVIFAYSQPCRRTVSVDLPLDTTPLTDGKHSLKVTVVDAAGNTAVVYDGTFSTHNAPEASSAPVLLGSGQAQVGTSLSSEPGEWSAPEGAGSITYAYQWRACDSSGEACQPIAGAESATYTPSPGDVGHTLRVALSAADADGKTTALSSPSAAVQAPVGSLGALPGPGSASSPLWSPAPVSSAGGTKPGGGASGASGRPRVRAIIHLGVRRRISRKYAHRAVRLRGRLLDLHHHPIAHAHLLVMQRVGHVRLKRIADARTGGRGAFRVRVRPGPSRLIEIAYPGAARHGYAAIAKVHENVRAGVRLRISPRQVGSTGTIVLSGRVLGHVPKRGVVVELMVHYHGSWEPFRDPRTDSRGRFSAAYRFQGAVGRFPFRAVVLHGQAAFSYTTGKSEVIHVKTR